MNKTTITNANGLPGNEVYNLALGTDCIWLSVEGSNICRWNGYKLTCYDKTITGLSTPTLRLYYDYNMLHLYEHGVGKYYVYQDSIWKQIQHSSKKKNTSEGTIFQDSTGILRRLIWDGQEFQKVDWNFEIEYTDLDGIGLSNGSNKYNLDFLVMKRNAGITSVIESKDSLPNLDGAQYLGSGIFKKIDGRIVYLSQDKNLHNLPSETESIRKGSVLNQEEMIVSHKDHYAIYGFDDFSINERLDDHDLGYFYKKGNRYFSNSHNGLIIRDEAINFFEGGLGDMVHSTHIVGEDSEGAIWFGGYKSGYSRYKDDQMTKYYFNNRNDNAMTARTVLDDGSMMFSSEKYNHILQIKDGEIREKEVFYKDDIRSTFYDSKRISDGLIALGGFKFGLGLIHSESLFTDSIKTIDEEIGFELDNVFCVVEDASKRIWSASQQEGLAIYDRNSDEAQSFLIEDDQDRHGVTSLVIDSLDNMWMGTFKGLFVLENVSSFDIATNDPYKAMKKVSLTPFEGNTTAVVQYDSMMVVAAEREIYFINLNQYYRGKEFDAFTYSYAYDLQGRASEENGTLIDSNGDLWIGTQEGYLQFEMDQLSLDTTMVDLYLEEVVIAKKKASFTNNKINLPPSNRNFSYSYNLTSNPSLRNNVYTYSSLVDAYNDTIFTELYDPIKSHNQFFLEPGHYRLIADTYKNNRLIDHDEYIINAQAFLSEKAWFWPLILGLGFLMFFYFQRKKSKREKLILEKDLKLSQLTQAQNQTQLQAIISSFNPHFINNSLHWAQSRYHEDETLVRVIGRLSENIQHIFLKTRHGHATHSLKEELRIVENYVLIQKVRFNDSFKYIAPDRETVKILEEIQIPIMQLQIHVENAIEHGLRNRIGSSYVKIEIEEEKEEIIFKIIDDGSGRKTARKLGSKGTQSGVEMLDRVHAIFNNSNKIKISQNYIDDFLNDHGTIVIVKIPKEYNYAI